MHFKLCWSQTFSGIWMSVKSYKCLEPPYVLCTLWSRLNKLAGCPILSCINQQYCIMFISRTQMPPASPWQFVQLVLLADQYLYRRHTLSNFNQFCGRWSWALARAWRPALVLQCTTIVLNQARVLTWRSCTWRRGVKIVYLAIY